MGTNTKSITDYVQTLQDIIPAIQIGLLEDKTIGQVYHIIAESNSIVTTPSILSTNPNQDPFNTTGDMLYLSSASLTDNQQIYIEGVLHSDGSIAGELATLNGQTAVQLTNVYKTILRAYNNNGIELSEAVYISSESNPTGGVPNDNNIYAHIPAYFEDKYANTTLSSTFTVPLGYSAFITNWTLTARKGKDIEAMAYSRFPNKVFTYRENISTVANTTSKVLPWLKFEELTDFKVEAITIGGTQASVITFDVVLLNNYYIGKLRRLSWR